MRRVARLLQYLRRDGLLLAEAVTLVWVIRLGLWLVAFARLSDGLSGLAGWLGRRRWRYRPSVARIGRAVDLVAGLVPQATCLTRALAAWVLLRQYGYPCELRIGVARDEADKLEAHAWVESDGAIVIGGARESLARYSRLAPLN